MNATEQKWLTFDCYGTLVDWRSGMEAALRNIVDDPADLLAAYHRHEHDVESIHPSPAYRDVLTEALRRGARDLAVPVPDQYEAVLADTLTSWPVFPETASTLADLRAAGWKLGILSNVDDVLIEQILPQLGAPIDVIITADSVGSYKPAHGHFERFATVTGATPRSWVHVGCSWFHDMIPAIEQGIPAVFVNRGHEMRQTSGVLAVMRDLRTLPEALDSALQHGRIGTTHRQD